MFTERKFHANKFEQRGKGKTNRRDRKVHAKTLSVKIKICRKLTKQLKSSIDPGFDAAFERDPDAAVGAGFVDVHPA